jgi:hypothetical protein
MNTTNFIIDNCVVTRYPTGVRLASIKLIKKMNKNFTEVNLPKISTGSRLSDNQLISKLADGDVHFDEVVNNYLPNI